MKKILVIAVTFLVLFSCNKKDENTMYVKGKIDGLKKGTLYLQKQIDSAFVSVDSISINGTSDFLLSDIVESPEIYFLSLGKGYKNIPFFGEKDSITINTKLDKFELKNPKYSFLISLPPPSIYHHKWWAYTLTF